MEFRTGGGALRFATFVLSCCEENIEAGPSVLLFGETFPGFAVINKEAGLVDELENDANDLFEAVGSVTGGVVVIKMFDPIKKGFNRLIYVIRGAGEGVVFL